MHTILILLPFQWSGMSLTENIKISKRVKCCLSLIIYDTNYKKQIVTSFNKACKGIIPYANCQRENLAGCRFNPASSNIFINSAREAIKRTTGLHNNIFSHNLILSYSNM